MAVVELEHAGGAQRAHFGARAVAEVFLHFEGDAALGGQAAGLGGELAAELDLRHVVADGLLDEVQKLPVLDVALVGGLLLVVGLEAEIVGHDVAEALAVLIVQALEHHFVERGGEIEDRIAAAADLLALGEAERVPDRVGAGVVDRLLALGHGLDVLLERLLLVLRGVEQQQLAQKVLVAAVLVAHAALEMHAVVFVELLVFGPVLAHEFLELALDALLDVLAHDLELAVVLEDLARDVEREVGGVHDALDELKVVVHELVALLHDHHAVGVERDAALGLAVELAAVLLAGDEEHGLVADRALGVDAHEHAGVLDVVVLLLVPGDAVVVRDLALGALPDGDHRVDGLLLLDHAVVEFGAAVVVFLAGLEALAVLDLHLDRPAHVVGVFLDEGLELPDLEVAAEDLVVGVGLDVHDDVGADRVAVNLRDGVAVRARALPLDALLLAVLAGEDGDLVGHHEGRVEAHAELADDAQVLGLGLVHLRLEGAGAGSRDDAEVLLGLLKTHADAVVAHGDGARLLVGDDVDAEIPAVEPDALVGQRQITELVDGVGGVGDDLAQEDLLVGVYGIDHQIEQSFGFRFELLLGHVCAFLRKFWPVAEPCPRSAAVVNIKYTTIFRKFNHSGRLRRRIYRLLTFAENGGLPRP